MHIDITPENILVQLGYPITDAMIAQAERIISNTVNFDSFSKHILSLKDELAHYGGYIAFSSSQDTLKIKCDSNNPDTLEAYSSLLDKWSNKYKVELERVGDSATYYINGQIA